MLRIFNKGHLIPKKRHPKKVKSFYFLSSCHLIPPKRHENDIQKSKNDFSQGKKVRIFPWKISFQIYIYSSIHKLTDYHGISVSPVSGRSCNSEHPPSNSILPLVYQKLLEAKISTVGGAFPAI